MTPRVRAVKGDGIHTILVATDFSAAARAAVDRACDFAERFGARMVVMHAYQIPMYGLPDGNLVATAEMASRILEGANRGLDDLAREIRARDIEVRTMLVQGESAEQIEKTALAVGADLLVLGTHGRRGVARALLGSTAEKLVRTSPIPVLTTHAARLEEPAFDGLGGG